MNMKTLKNNLVLILLGIGGAFGLVYLFQGNALLQASILSLSDYATIKKNNRDMAYKTQNNRLEVFCSDTIDTNTDTIVIDVVYDSVNIHWNQADYQGNININNKSLDESTITINDIKQLNCKESIIDIPFEGEYSNIIVNTILTNDKDMRIGNLNKKTSHHK